MKIDVSTDAGSLAAAIGAEVGSAASGAIDDTLPGTKDELSEQILSAGLGQRLARTWRGTKYENAGGAGPAGFIWSRAPLIVQAFASGATIRPINGAKYLWIPTANVPKGRKHLDASGRVQRGGAMAPDEVERRYNAQFFFRPGKSGSLLALLDVSAGLNGRGKRPRKGARLTRGRNTASVLMFVLMPSVKEPKLLDIDAVAERWGDAFEAAFTERLAE